MISRNRVKEGLRPGSFAHAVSFKPPPEPTGRWVEDEAGEYEAQDPHGAADDGLGHSGEPADQAEHTRATQTGPSGP
jgi:hypothetical protein